MGRHAAGKSYLRAIAESDFESAGFLIPNKSHTQNFIDTFSPFLKDNKKMNVEMISYNSSSISKKYGGIFINDPQVGNYALHRSDGCTTFLILFFFSKSILIILRYLVSNIFFNSFKVLLVGILKYFSSSELIFFIRGCTISP